MLPGDAAVCVEALGYYANAAMRENRYRDSFEALRAAEVVAGEMSEHLVNSGWNR